ncbi:MAG: squalene/phytoene synthase family protein, partial [Dehalococcoidia bacterium]
MPALAPRDRDRLLKDILKSVSRAFYLTLRILPGGLRESVGLAYLLARAADTIADTRALEPEERLARLLDF